MVRLFKILILLFALGFLGWFFWSHKDQALDRAASVLTSARQASSTPATASSAVTAETSVPSEALLPVTVLELTKVPLTGKTEKFTTLDGDQYTGVIKRVEPDGIVLRTSDGVPKLKFKNLPPAIGAKYGYDPELEIQFLRYRQSENVAAYQKALQGLDEKANKETTLLENTDSLRLKAIISRPNEKLEKAKRNRDLDQKLINDTQDHLNYAISSQRQVSVRNAYGYVTLVDNSSQIAADREDLTKHKSNLQQSQKELDKIEARAVGLKSGEADRQRVEERTRQNS